MTDSNYSLTADDDLPRTLRREREARERAKREEEARKRRGTLTHDFDQHAPAAASHPAHAEHAQDAVAATVTGFDVPFFRLMMFFIKAVFAGVPALIILGAMLWLAGDVLRNIFPWLVKMQILIRFPG